MQGVYNLRPVKLHTPPCQRNKSLRVPQLIPAFMAKAWHHYLNKCRAPSLESRVMQRHHVSGVRRPIKTRLTNIRIIFLAKRKKSRHIRTFYFNIVIEKPYIPIPRIGIEIRIEKLVKHFILRPRQIKILPDIKIAIELCAGVI
jgi:hypothetical protein